MKTDTRSCILDAALTVVARQGAANLTLDAVAREAGKSKGGLLYHFPNKEALIVGMVDRLNREFDEALEEQSGRDSGPGSFLRAYIQLSFSFESGLFPVMSALLAAVANQPELLLPFQQAFARWQTRLENDGLDPARATLVRLAVDGLWFSDMFDLAAPEGGRRQAIQQQLMEMTRP